MTTLPAAPTPAGDDGEECANCASRGPDETYAQWATHACTNMLRSEIAVNRRCLETAQEPHAARYRELVKLAEDELARRGAPYRWPP